MIVRIHHLLSLALVVIGAIAQAQTLHPLEGANGPFLTPEQVGSVDGVLFFRAVNGYGSPRLLWRSDGTTEGTRAVNPNDAAGNIFKDGSVYFATTDNIHSSIWRIGAHDAEASFLFSPSFLFDGDHWSVGDGLFAFGSPGRFLGQPGRFEDFTVRLSDGTEAGETVLQSYGWPSICYVEIGYCLLVLRPQLQVPNAGPFIELSHGTIFVANGNKTFQSDGTPTGMREIPDFSLSPDPAFWAVVDGTLFFTRLGPKDDMNVSPFELWKMDGTPESMERVARIGSSYSPIPDHYIADANYGTEIVAFGGRIFFAGADDHGQELWESDGTEAGTHRFADLVPNDLGSAPRSFSAASGSLFFTAWTPDAGDELWRSDGTEAGTVRISDIDPGAGRAKPSRVVFSHGKVFFSATEPNTGTEPYESDGTLEGTHLLADLVPGPDSSYPSQFTAAGRRVFFDAGVVNQRTLWALDVSPCPGDCDGDERVTIAELVRGVDIVLGRVAFDRCPALDGDDDQHAGVNDLVAAVSSTLHGCP